MLTYQEATNQSLHSINCRIVEEFNVSTHLFSQAPGWTIRHHKSKLLKTTRTTSGLSLIHLSTVASDSCSIFNTDPWCIWWREETNKALNLQLLSLVLGLKPLTLDFVMDWIKKKVKLHQMIRYLFIPSGETSPDWSAGKHFQNQAKNSQHHRPPVSWIWN